MGLGRLARMSTRDVVAHRMDGEANRFCVATTSRPMEEWRLQWTRRYINVLPVHEPGILRGNVSGDVGGLGGCRTPAHVHGEGRLCAS
jgi:hypothetical protein